MPAEQNHVRRQIAAPSTTSAAQIRSRILAAFADRAAESSIRGVRMDDLAADLGMSKKTLYQHYRSKQQLVAALLDEWIERTAREQREWAKRGLSPSERLRAWGETWVTSVGRFSRAFWSELRRDYPDAYARYDEAARQNRLDAARSLARHIRPGLSPEIALELLRGALERGIDPTTSARLDVSPREAVGLILDVWTQGALRASAQRPAQASR
jgi:AcrR family transcriptional regulator